MNSNTRKLSHKKLYKQDGKPSIDVWVEDIYQGSCFTSPDGGVRNYIGFKHQGDIYERKDGKAWFVGSLT